MEKENKKTTEIPFGAKDSELNKFEYTIPEGYEARIEGNKVIVTKKESEDEKIRKELIGHCKDLVRMNKDDKVLLSIYEPLLAYLEKQREQKPAEWSEEDEKMIERIVETIQDYALETGQIDRVTCGTKEPLISYIRFLRSIRPRTHWKPSKKQIDALNSIILTGSFTYVGQTQDLISLKDEIKKLL